MQLNEIWIVDHKSDEFPKASEAEEIFHGKSDQDIADYVGGKALHDRFSAAYG